MAAEASRDALRRYWAPQAWIDGGWRHDVLLTAQRGFWLHIDTPVPRADAIAAGAQALRGPVLPGLCNAHSHAFQRAMAGLAETRAAGEDDFWSWRERMYAVAHRITPEQLQAVAAQLYVELLKGGYTQVCEFHYLHNDAQGRSYADGHRLAQGIAAAAEHAGIGLTLLPTLYMRAGFDAPGLRDEQRRFASTPQSVAELAQRFGRQTPTLHAGIAIHSLRAVGGAAIGELLQAVGPDLPVHLHIAEQQREVRDCQAALGASPVHWLLDNLPVDARWHLVHATHASAAELRALAARGATVVICPTTEANLGDGWFDWPAHQAAGGRWSIGSDSHVSRDAAEELRWLEYGQRLRLQRRNVSATGTQASTAAVLFDGALHGGAAAAGLPLAGIRPGMRADLLVLDGEAPALRGVPPPRALDAWLFSSPAQAVRDVFVAGRAVIVDGRHADEEAIAQRFEAAMHTLHG
jgi:formimidoylglutamate deiminase